MREDKSQQYQQVLACLHNDNTLYWSRNHFFLVVITGLLGFVANNLLKLSDPATWLQLFVMTVLTSAGIVLTVVWIFMLKAGDWWINHWHALLRALEPDVYDGLDVHRVPSHKQGGPKRLSVRLVFKFTVGFALILWVLGGIYMVTAWAGSAKQASVPDAALSIAAVVVNDKGIETALVSFLLDCQGGDCALSTSTFGSKDRIMKGTMSAFCIPMQSIVRTSRRTLTVSANARMFSVTSLFTADGCDGLTRLKLDFEVAPVATGKYRMLKSFSGVLTRESDGAVQAHLLPLRSAQDKCVDLPTLPE